MISYYRLNGIYLEDIPCEQQLVKIKEVALSKGFVREDYLPILSEEGLKTYFNNIEFFEVLNTNSLHFNQGPARIYLDKYESFLIACGYYFDDTLFVIDKDWLSVINTIKNFVGHKYIVSADNLIIYKVLPQAASLEQVIANLSYITKEEQPSEMYWDLLDRNTEGHWLLKDRQGDNAFLSDINKIIHILVNKDIAYKLKKKGIQVGNLEHLQIPELQRWVNNRFVYR
jgi:hypothetical protein